MCDTYLYRQKFFFWADMSTEMAGNTVIPTKKRLWLIVSNNETNQISSNVTVVPVYTRDEVTKPTHVSFKNGDRNCVVVCEDIMSIPRAKIKPCNYAGVCSDELWAKVHNAIINQFKVDDTATKIEEYINNMLNDRDFNEAVVKSIVSAYTKSTITATITSNTAKNTTVQTDNNDGASIPTTKASITNKKRNSTHRNSKSRKTKNGHTQMSDIIAKQFLEDCTNMTIDELNVKYKKYVKLDNRASLSKKVYSLRKRLGMLERA